MDRPAHSVLIISRDALLKAEEATVAPRIFRALANITRKGTHLLLTAPEPDSWFPTRGTDDGVLSVQSRILGKIHEAGGDLDGIYYVPRSLFTQDRNRRGALKDILERYAVKAENVVLISSSQPFIRTADSLDIHTLPIDRDEAGLSQLAEALATLPNT